VYDKLIDYCTIVFKIVPNMISTLRM